MQVMAFDFGLVRIGVAVGQSITKTASPLETVRTKKGAIQWEVIKKLLVIWEPSLLLIGLPLNMDASPQHLTKKAKTFANQLYGRFGIKIEMMDERLSSVAARSILFESGGYKKLKKTAIDSIAAVLILESWFEQLEE
jgi:putative Holliday junction resolvase